MSADQFEIKDSGERQEFGGGMVRDTCDGKTNFVSLVFGPMLRRWADHLTKGRAKYPDPQPGLPNWTLAEGEAEYHRFRESAFRHFIAWLNDERDEDHGAAVFFNINGAEYVRDKMAGPVEAPPPDDKPWHIIHPERQIPVTDSRRDPRDTTPTMLQGTDLGGP